MRVRFRFRPRRFGVGVVLLLAAAFVASWHVQGAAAWCGAHL